jgi:hypothetical protein
MANFAADNQRLINEVCSSQDVRVAPEHPLDLWSLLQSVATKRTERKKAAEPSAEIFCPNNFAV